MYRPPLDLAKASVCRHMQLVHKQRELARIVIDEALCISEWGLGFRRDFFQLGWLRQSFPDIPIICLTATNEPVLKDILDMVRLDPVTTVIRVEMTMYGQHYHVVECSGCHCSD